MIGGRKHVGSMMNLSEGRIHGYKTHGPTKKLASKHGMHRMYVWNDLDTPTPCVMATISTASSTPSFHNEQYTALLFRGPEMPSFVIPPPCELSQSRKKVHMH